MGTKSLLVAALVSTAVLGAVGLAQGGMAAPATSAKPVIGTFGFDLAGMDRTVDPGDDFNQYAGGTWIKNTPIPADKTLYGAFDQLYDLSTERMRTILEDKAKTSGSQIGDFYASFMDEATIDSLGAAPLKPWFDRIDAATDKTQLAVAMAGFDRIGGGDLFRVGIDQDDKVPDDMIVMIRQGGLGLPDRDYYVNTDAKIAAQRATYVPYTSKMMALTGVAQGDDARMRAEAVFAYEGRLAAAHWERKDVRDADKTYNKWTYADLTAKAPGFPWDAWGKAMGFEGQKTVLVAQPSAITGEAAAFAATPLPVLKDHVRLMLIARYAWLLSKPIADARFDFLDRGIWGQPEPEPRWKRGANLVDGEIGEALGKEYVARYFPPASKAAADALVHNVIAAMGRRIDKLTWMTPATKMNARGKLAAFTPKIGYPNKWRDYSSVVVRRDDVVGNVARANAFQHQRALDKLGKPIDRSEWGMTPSTVNAYANPVWNEIVFPAAILQPPFFDINADPAINYGGIGAVIGHEISHHFDDQGRKYDARGTLTNWWTADDVKRFTAQTDALVKQYNGYQPLPGMNVKGDVTLGENIADLAGLAVAYDAYHTSLGGRPAPVIGGLTGDQRFFLGWAQVFRVKAREDGLRAQVMLDFHSPDQYRVNVVRNFDSWYAAFNPKPAGKFYLAPAARVRIW